MLQYLYSFDTFAWHDRVFAIDDSSFSYKAGDIIADGERLLLCLGDTVAFAEQYTMFYRPYQDLEIVEKRFFSPLQLALLHHIVENCYTVYKAAMRLLLPPMDLRSLLSYKKSTKKPQYTELIFDDTKNYFIHSTEQKQGQQLILIPDLRTGENLFADAVLDQSTLRHSGSTALQMTKMFRWTKQGQIGTLMTTFAGIFHDWKELQQIIFIQPHKRYYQHQQDPRYKVAEVIDFIAEQTGAELIKWG